MACASPFGQIGAAGSRHRQNGRKNGPDEEVPKIRLCVRQSPRAPLRFGSLPSGRQMHPIAAKTFRLIKRLIGRHGQAVEIRLAIIGRDPDRGRQADHLSPGQMDVAAAQGLKQPLSEGFCRLWIHLSEGHQKLFTAIAEDVIADPGRLKDRLCAAAQRQISGGVTVKVIDPLEMIEIDQSHRKILPLPPRRLNLTGKDRIHKAAA